MTTKNLIKKDDKFKKEYFATVVSNDDPLRRGRLQVKVNSILGDIPFWVNATLVAGSVKFLLIPNQNDVVSVKFKNGDIYSGEWSLNGSPINGTEESYIDPNKYGFSDNQGNLIIIDRATNDITINSMNNYNVTVVGNVNIKCANAVVNAEKTTVNGLAEINGDTTINGNTNINGTLTATDSCTFEGIAWKPHTHPYTWTASAGSGNTGAPQ